MLVVRFELSSCTRGMLGRTWNNELELVGTVG